MTTRKNYNSIVFLTTLSVYLGLVLIGAPTQVLAQNASITFEERLKQDKDFRRIVEECEKIKPRIERKGYGEDVVLSYSIDDFINALIDLSAHSICTAPEGFAFVSEISYPSSPQYLTRLSLRQKPASKGTWTSGVLSAHIENVGNSLPHIRKRGETYFQIDFELDKTNLYSVTKFTQDSSEQAQQTADLYKISLKNWQSVKRNTSESAIYENTKVSSENNQVFIVTRLPRGSLDALFTQSAK